jgi:hypothetical protein
MQPAKIWTVNGFSPFHLKWRAFKKQKMMPTKISYSLSHCRELESTPILADDIKMGRLDLCFRIQRDLIVKGNIMLQITHFYIWYVPSTYLINSSPLKLNRWIQRKLEQVSVVVGFILNLGSHSSFSYNYLDYCCFTCLLTLEWKFQIRILTLHTCGALSTYPE